LEGLSSNLNPDSLSSADFRLLKLFLAKEEPLQASLPPRPSNLLQSLRGSRKKYTALLKEKSRAPDAKYGGWNVPLKNSTRSPRLGEGGSNLDLVNPLSLHNEVGN
jgi:TBC1 domain family protein 5